MHLTTIVWFSCTSFLLWNSTLAVEKSPRTNTISPQGSRRMPVAGSRRASADPSDGSMGYRRRVTTTTRPPHTSSRSGLATSTMTTATSTSRLSTVRTTVYDSFESTTKPMRTVVQSPSNNQPVGTTASTSSPSIAVISIPSSASTPLTFDPDQLPAGSNTQSSIEWKPEIATINASVSTGANASDTSRQQTSDALSSIAPSAAAARGSFLPNSSVDLGHSANRTSTNYGGDGPAKSTSTRVPMDVGSRGEQSVTVVLAQNSTNSIDGNESANTSKQNIDAESHPVAANNAQQRHSMAEARGECSNRSVTIIVGEVSSSVNVLNVGLIAFACGFLLAFVIFAALLLVWRQWRKFWRTKDIDAGYGEAAEAAEHQPLQPVGDQRNDRSVIPSNNSLLHDTASVLVEELRSAGKTGAQLERRANAAAPVVNPSPLAPPGRMQRRRGAPHVANNKPTMCKVADDCAVEEMRTPGEADMAQALSSHELAGPGGSCSLQVQLRMVHYDAMKTNGSSEETGVVKHDAKIRDAQPSIPQPPPPIGTLLREEHTAYGKNRRFPKPSIRTWDKCPYNIYRCNCTSVLSI